MKPSQSHAHRLAQSAWPILSLGALLLALPVAQGDDTCCGGKPSFPGQAGYATFSGQVAVLTCFPANPTSGAYNPAGFAVGVVDLQNPAPPVNVNYPAPIYHGPGTAWTGSQLGTIFGVCLDAAGNIYVTPTTCYSTDVAGTLGGFGTVYKLDGVTGLPGVFATLPNTGNAGLGNIKYSCQHASFYVSDIDDGKIYWLNPSGTVLGSWDHGANLPGAAFPTGLTAIPDNPAAAFTPLGRRVWGLKPYNGRLYYAIWWEDQGRPDAAHTNEIWSIALTPAGAFIPGTQVREILLPAVANSGTPYSNPVSDISFGPTGTMLLAERTMGGDSFPGAHNSRLLEYVYASGSWTLPNPTKYQVSQLYPPGSDAGGCDYDFSPGGRVWTTGDAIHLSYDAIYGLQGLPSTGGSILNSVLIDADNNTSSAAVKTEIGDVELPCVGGGCLLITNELTDCIGTNGTFSYTFCVTNQYNGPIAYLSLLDPPAGVTFTPDIIALTTTLQPGQGACQSVTVTYTGAVPTNLCFRIGAHTTNFVQCCATPHCISLPKCCVYVSRDTVKPLTGQPNCYNYTFSLKNVTTPPVPIQYILLVPPPGSCFHFSPDIIYLPVPLAPGQTVFISTVTLCLTPPCPGPYCFTVSVHDTNFVECCAAQHCLARIVPPIVITNPASDATFVVPTDIPLIAVADPTVGINQVNFLANDALVAVATKPPGTNTAFTAVWSNAPAGTYALTADALDNTGSAWVSDPVTIIVFGGPPPPVPAPLLTAGQISRGRISFVMKTDPGVTYHVECSDSLTAPNWQLLEVITGDGSMPALNYACTNAPQRFYRVRVP